jgi:hypothetical protein
MKICFLGIPGINVGKHNVKDPRLDQADKLVEAKKKICVQVDVLPESDQADADGLICSADTKPDLILNDLEFVETRLGRGAEGVELGLLKKIKPLLDAEKFVFGVETTPEEAAILASYRLSTAKPVVVGGPDAAEQSGTLVYQAYQLAGFISFLTVGGKENRAWQIKKGATAWDAAGAIHTDIQKGFIRAEIINFEDLAQAGGETQAKRAGKMRLETKEYVMLDGDITNFRFNK